MSSDSAFLSAVKHAQLAFLIAGLIVWFSFFVREKENIPGLPKWRIPASVFGLLCILAFLGAGAGGAAGATLTSLLPEKLRSDVGFITFLSNAAMHAGILLGLCCGKVVMPLMMNRDAATGLPDPVETVPEEPQSNPSTATLFANGGALFLATFALLTGVALGWQWLLERLGAEIADQDLVKLVAGTRDPVKLTLMALTATVLAPITEELIFRAGLFRFLLHRTPRWVAHVFSAAAFAALHHTLSVLVPLFFFGLLFSYAYEKTRRIEVTMLAHGMFNLNTLMAIMAGLHT